MIYQIHHYPAELIDIVRLRDGGRVIVRPVLPQDRELMVAFFHDLSAEARCNRFMHPVSEPSSELLRQFTHVDYVDHVALVAEIFTEGREIVIGEARYVRETGPLLPRPSRAKKPALDDFCSPDGCARQELNKWKHLSI